MLTEGNTKCRETKIENCISGVVIGSDIEICSVCAYFHPSDDFRQCSTKMDIENCLFGGLTYSKLVEFRSKENLYALSQGKGVVTNLDPSFFSQIEGTVSRSVNIALSERLQNYRSTCVTCLPGYSKYSGNVNSCESECVEGCDMCSGSNRSKCLKCKEWLGYYETGVSTEGYVECTKIASLEKGGLIILVMLYVLLGFN